MSEQEKQQKLKDMRLRAETLRSEIVQANQDSVDMQGEYAHIQKRVLRMV